MKTYTEATQHIKVIDKTFCDICGNEFTKPHHTTGDIEEIIIRHRRGEEYPEGGYGDMLDMDVCPACMNKIIVPFLKSVAKRIEYVEWEL
jgi:hypothetical protein